MVDENILNIAVKYLSAFNNMGKVISLIKALHSVKPAVRVEATKALGKIRDRRAADQLIEVLIEMLNDSEFRVQWATQQALSELCADSPMLKMCRRPNSLVILFEHECTSCTRIVGQLHELDAIPNLMQHKKESIRIDAIEAVETYGKDYNSRDIARSHIKLLMSPMEDIDKLVGIDKEVCIAAFRSLVSLGDIQVLKDFLKSENPDILFLEALFDYELDADTEKNIHSLLAMAWYNTQNQEIKNLLYKWLGREKADKLYRQYASKLGTAMGLS